MSPASLELIWRTMKWMCCSIDWIMRLCASESSPPSSTSPIPLLSHKDTIPPPPPNLPILPLPFDGADICISNTFMGCQVLVGYRTLGAPFSLQYVWRCVYLYHVISTWNASRHETYRLRNQPAVIAGEIAPELFPFFFFFFFFLVHLILCAF